MNKYQLILSSPPIIISDEKVIKEGDKMYTHVGIEVAGYDGYSFEKNGEFAKKIIAGLSNLYEIDYSMLSDVDCIKIGHVNIVNISNNILIEYNKHVSFCNKKNERHIFTCGVNEGFKTAQYINNKQFSLEDMVNIFNKLRKNGLIQKSDKYTHELISEQVKLLYPKTFNVELETHFECCEDNDYTCQYCDQTPYPKITDNSIKITKILNESHNTTI